MNWLRNIWELPGKWWSGALKAATLRTWAMILAAPPLTGLLAWLIYIFAYTVWPLATAELRIKSLANISYGLLLLIGLVVVALTGVSLVANVSKDGASVNVTDDNVKKAPDAAP